MTVKMPQPEQPALPPENYTDLPVGEILRRTRVHYGQSLDDVANYLRIRASQIEALERGEIDKLPGRAYAIGYVRTYSEYLGLDGEKMIHLFKAQSGARTSKPELHFPVPASESKAPNLLVICGSLAALALVIGVSIALSRSGGEEDLNVTAIPDVPAEMRVSDDSANPAADMSSVMTTPAPAAITTSIQVPDTGDTGDDDAAKAQDAMDAAVTKAVTATAAPVQKKEITINVKERSWVEVRDKQGKAILSRILKPGEVFIVPEENYGLRLDTGNAGGLELLVNGQPLPALGKQGDILRGLVLDGSQLLQKFEPAGGVQH